MRSMTAYDGAAQCVAVASRSLPANQSPPRIKSGAGFRWKTLWASVLPLSVDEMGMNRPIGKCQLPAAAQRLEQLHEVERHVGRARGVLLFGLQQRPFGIKHGEKIGDAFIVPGAGKIERLARMVALRSQSGVAALSEPMGDQRFDDVMPGLQHRFVIEDGGFLLLCVAQFERVPETATSENTQRDAGSQLVLQR